MKQLVSILLLMLTTFSFGQESSSFLTRNQPVKLFSGYDSFERDSTFQFKLPSERGITSEPYVSGFKNFMANDTRLLNYPSADLSDANNVIFGNFMNTAVDLGNTKLNTIYIFDQSGRLVNSSASFSFGKKKKRN